MVANRFVQADNKACNFTRHINCATVFNNAIQCCFTSSISVHSTRICVQVDVTLNHFFCVVSFSPLWLFSTASSTHAHKLSLFEHVVTRKYKP